MCEAVKKEHLTQLYQQFPNQIKEKPIFNYYKDKKCSAHFTKQGEDTWGILKTTIKYFIIFFFP
jgi:hypothetical protein